MSTDPIQDLNSQFAIADHLAFIADPGGSPCAVVRNAHAHATIALQGGDVISFQPHGHAPVLWVSGYAVYREGTAIRGGIPLCWPWFGPHPTDPAKPAHGFVRTRPWAVSGASISTDGQTEIRLTLAEDAQTLALWPHPFVLELVVTVGPALRVALVAGNSGQQPFVCGGALHSYFSVGDVTATTIRGLEGHSYVDKVDGGRASVQQGPVTIAGETDRVYQQATEPCVIDDPTLRRRIVVAKKGSRSTVVWNPWKDKARNLADFGDEEYTRMLCVEVANALDDTATVAPGDHHRLETTISVQHML